jgi:hypothetical protein
MGIGDIISQVAFEDKGIKGIDKGRVIRFAGIGLIFMVSIKVLSVLCQMLEQFIIMLPANNAFSKHIILNGWERL